MATTPAPTAAPAIKPTVGRKVWLWAQGGGGFTIFDRRQPIDATVIFVHEDGTVNLSLVDHAGNCSTAFDVELKNYTAESHDTVAGLVATWMPYQMGQAAAAAKA